MQFRKQQKQFIRDKLVRPFLELVSVCSFGQQSQHHNIAVCVGVAKEEEQVCELFHECCGRHRGTQQLIFCIVHR